MKIKKGDKIKVMYGKNRGQEGKVEKVYVKSEKILIQGVNLYKRHIKKNDKLPQGGIVDVPRPILASKVMIICPKCGKVTRVGVKIDKNKKFRICRKCDNKI
ncbi:MAG: 50S ribosomal protein L24 [Candidatus Roizmanbacteria bacterium GW2011_GWA2_35_19]|uniref:Large ribosomal subunit protein uL24 n=2 Tax=Candidatus Roizmaniibacteriota TaxID=1752723 RepID=A0A0G0BRB5_9BACT|nr:MAG: 50S ribosomal protein L24 [Candidatus Roizmanbacteria bacterium GW2011_GWC2_35_12]KKP72024.1 MAG: 50S ribosomal protein L24 [Candidatus Roizmanbacteria bacterium GW2011_GWA2_35_19]